MSVRAYVEDSRGQLVPQEFALQPHGRVFYQAMAKLTLNACQTHGVVRVVRGRDRLHRERWLITRDGIEDPGVEPWWLVSASNNGILNGRFDLIVNQDFEFHYLANHENPDGSRHESFLAILEPTVSLEPLSDLDRLVVEKSILHYIKHHGLK